MSRYYLSHASCGSVRNLNCVPIEYLAKWVSFGEGRVNNLEKFCPKVCLNIPGEGGVEPGDQILVEIDLEPVTCLNIAD